MSDEDLIELVAKNMWDWCHDGTWEDVDCVPNLMRMAYLTDARIAIETIRSVTVGIPNEQKTL